MPRFRPSHLRKAKAAASPRGPKPRGTHAPLGFGRQPAFGLTSNHALLSRCDCEPRAFACSRRCEEARTLNCGLRIGRSARLLTSSATLSGSMRPHRDGAIKAPLGPDKNSESTFVVCERGANLGHESPEKGKLVGATGFEPATSWSQTKRSTKLSYAPIAGATSSPASWKHKGLRGTSCGRVTAAVPRNVATPGLSTRCAGKIGRFPSVAIVSWR